MLPYCKVERKDGEIYLVKSASEHGEHAESIFPVNYIYDPAKKVEYVEWKLKDGLLEAREKLGDWFVYTSKAESTHAMHEYVGGCWFVFERVTFSKGEISLEPSSGCSPVPLDVLDIPKVGNDVACIQRKYFLEGVIHFSSETGWLSWEIGADSFYIETP